MSILRLCVVSIFVLAAVGQTVQQRPVFSNVPFWPANGVPPPELADFTYVYADYAAQEFVVSFPENLGTGNPATGRRVQFRIEKQDTVEPAVSVELVKTGNGDVTYRYAVRNGAQARRGIREFGLVVAEHDKTVVLNHPSWAANVPPPPAPPIPEWARGKGGPEMKVRAGAGRMVSWRGGAAAAVSPSAALGNFTTKSHFLPGIVPAYFSSGVTPAASVTVPAPVAAQLQNALSPDNNWRRVVTVGPKFDPDYGPSRDPVWIANDFRLEIEKLKMDGSLRGASPFIAELTGLLDVVSRGGQRIAFEYRSRPDSELARAIGEAVRMSLSAPER